MTNTQFQYLTETLESLGIDFEVLDNFVPAGSMSATRAVAANPRTADIAFAALRKECPVEFDADTFNHESYGTSDMAYFIADS